VFIFIFTVGHPASYREYTHENDHEILGVHTVVGISLQQEMRRSYAHHPWKTVGAYGQALKGRHIPAMGIAHGKG
jgi:hypothetical protein